mmetsp:Transcript_5047/g.9742  ORF Transcript_5047/g.9742 Transcript_5047/m.9742 type:complete len:924 (+) Transcript_5047:91-2862(+)|eukprot:CAMPEP_0175130192 /NCGR_PEP_ID=MMETSP0087-20121206/5878_1 /TAXON_ID=136419 /ORGANISM="Unknown Unknown, Strain D1" /LENGTH=923 /DNA_ID=CAMNT_0016412399 /DNA_START=75 /DNA_END=2846 /DNA_ORIENTATION=-
MPAKKGKKKQQVELSVMPEQSRAGNSPTENLLFQDSHVNKNATSCEERIEKAMRHRHLTCPYEQVRGLKDEVIYRPYSICGFRDQDFEKYGLGIWMYFQTIRRLAWIWFMIGLLYLPSLIIYVYNTQSWDPEDSSSKTGLEFLTLGNLLQVKFLNGTGTVLGDNVNSTTINVLGKQLTYDNVQMILSLNDIVASTFLLLACWWLKAKQHKESIDYKSRIVTVTHYTVSVTGFPKDFHDRVKLADWFEERYGAVKDVAFTFNDHAMLDQYQRRGHLRLEMQAAALKGDKSKHSSLQDKVAALDTALEKMHTTVNLQALAAYVTFEHTESRVACVRDFDFNFKSLKSRFKDKNKLMFMGHKLKVKQADEPSNLIFSNLIYSRWNRIMRRFVTFFITIFCIGCSFTFVFLSQYYRSASEGTTNCSRDFPTVKVFKDKSSVEAFSSDAKVYRQAQYCFCEAILFSDSKDYPCQTLLKETVLAYAMFILSILSVVVVNFVLKLIMTRLVAWEKHTSFTEGQTQVTWKLFISQTINTAFVVVLVNADFTSVGAATAKIGLTNAGDKFADFEGNWYSVVGVSIIITMLVSVFHPHFVPVVSIPIVNCCRNRKAPKMVTQSQMNALYSGKKFILATRYASMLTTIYVCAIYCSAMPILCFIASFTLMFKYWFDKIAFLRLYATPPRMDNHLNSLSLNLIVWAVVVHCGFSFWAFSGPVLTAMTSTKVVKKLSNLRIWNIQMLDMKDRLAKSYYAIPLLAFLFFVLVVQFMRCFCNLCFSGEDDIGVKEKKFRPFSAQTVLMEKYHSSELPEYHDAFIRTPSMKQLHPPAELKQQRDKVHEIKYRHGIYATGLHEYDDQQKHEVYHHTSHEPQNAYTRSQSYHGLPHQEYHKQRNSQMVQVHCPVCYYILLVADHGIPAQYSCPACSGTFMV